MLEWPDVLKVLHNLLELQNVDAQLSGVRARLAGIPAKISQAEARVSAAKADLDTSKAAQLATIKDRKKYELDVEQWKEKARKYRDQMSQVKTNDAYKALQHEVQNAEAEIASAEDRLLEQMVSAEEYDRRIKSSEKSLRAAEESTRAEQARIQADKTATERELATLEAERARALADVPEDMLDHYARIAKKHNGIALAEVKDEKCTACGMRIRPHVFQEMRRAGSTEIFHCETCTRILYYPDAEEAPTGVVDPTSPAAAGAGTPGHNA